MFLAFAPATRAASRSSAWRRDVRLLLRHIPKREAKKANRTVAKMMVTTRPEVVRLFWRTMHVVSPAGWVWQIRPGAQLIIGVKVGIQVEPVDAPFVDVMHQVVDICEVVKHTRGPVVELVEEEVVEVIVVGGVLEAELGVEEAGVALVDGISVEEGVSVVDGSAVEGDSVEGVAEGESEVDGASAVVCASLVLASALVLASVTTEAAVEPLFFCRFLKSPNPSSLGGMLDNPQKPQIALEVMAASASGQPPVTRHWLKLFKLFDSS
jgi:hypothetical protein